jgi:hypothetical protein
MASARALPALPPLASPHTAPLAGDAANPHAARPARPSQPRDGRANLRACVEDLHTALDEGWEIVQPIFARPLWSVADDSATAFNFVLRRERATRLVTVPEGRGVQRFIRDHHLAVDYRG